jgi:hypothetical protein
LGYPHRRFGSKIASADKEGDGVGVGPVTKQVEKGNDPHGGRVCERDMARVRVGYGMARQNYCITGGCRHLKFRSRGITQEKTYNIQNTAKV